MTLRISAGARNYALHAGSLKNVYQGGKLKIYTGTQPATAEAAPTGTLLVTVTAASGAHTQEVRATGTITLSGSSGSVTACTANALAIIGAAVPFNTSLAITAADLAAAINDYNSEPKWSATSSGAVVTVIAPLGMGAAANGMVLDSTCTTLVGTDVNIGSTVAGVTAVNGLNFGAPSAGVMPKLSTQTWSGVAANSGTAGWFRFESAVTDSGALDSTESQFRMDGAISTSGAQLNMSSTTVTALATQTITSFPVTFPTS